MINVARYVRACTSGAHVNLTKAQLAFRLRGKIDSCNMELLNYVRVKSRLCHCLFVHSCLTYRPNQP